MANEPGTASPKPKTEPPHYKGRSVANSQLSKSVRYIGAKPRARRVLVSPVSLPSKVRRRDLVSFPRQPCGEATWKGVRGGKGGEG